MIFLKQYKFWVSKPKIIKIETNLAKEDIISEKILGDKPVVNMCEVLDIKKKHPQIKFESISDKIIEPKIVMGH